MTAGFMCNTTVTVLRGTAPDVYGDEQDTAVEAYEMPGIPASILEQTQGGFGTGTRRADSGVERSIRLFVGRVHTRFDVRVGDRLRDDRSGLVFIVDSLAKLVSPVLNDSYKLELRRID